MAIFASFTPLVEPISLDEAFLDVTASAAAFGDGANDRADDQAARPRRGGPGRLGRGGHEQALRQGRLRPAEAGCTGRRPARRGGRFLAPLPIRRLWGVGPQPRPRSPTTESSRSGSWPRPHRTRCTADSGDSATTCRRALAALTVAACRSPRREERRPRAHVRYRLGRGRPSRGNPARLGRIGRQPPAPARAGGGIGPAQASVRGVRDPRPARRRCPDRLARPGSCTTRRWRCCAERWSPGEASGSSDSLPSTSRTLSSSPCSTRRTAPTAWRSRSTRSAVGFGERAKYRARLLREAPRRRFDFGERPDAPSSEDEDGA